MSEYLSFPQVHIERGEGCWLYDTDGNRYLDANASVWTNVHGHGDSELNEALKSQMEQISHSTWLGLSHPIGTRFSEKLIELTPASLTRCFFSDNGSNAIEIALKQSFQYWQLSGYSEKRLAVSMEGAYHGDTFGTMSVSGSDNFHGRFENWCYESRRFPAPSETDASASLAALEALLKAESEQVACLLLEPWVQGAAGMQVQPLGFVKAVAELCKTYDVHPILDEVFVGFGRCGAFFVCQKEGVEPEFLCLAKGLSAGYLPMAATLTTEKIYQAFLGPFEANRTFFHGHTFTANPLAAAVSLKSAEKLEAMIASGQLKQTIETFSTKLREHFESHPHVSALRQRGLAAAIDLQQKSGEAYTPTERKGMAIAMHARKHGLIIRSVGDTILMVPPLCISAEEIEFLCTHLTQTIEDIL